MGHDHRQEGRDKRTMQSVLSLQGYGWDYENVKQVRDHAG